MRAWFQKYDQLLEHDLLTFGEDDEEPWHEKIQNRLECPPPPQCPDFPPRRIGSQTPLEHVPSPLTFPQVDMYIEWVYVIDLDREEFRVESWGYRWNYNLNEIPRDDLWWVRDDDGVDNEAADDNGTDDDQKDGKDTHDDHREDEHTKGDDDSKDDERTRNESTGASDDRIDSTRETKEGFSDPNGLEVDLSVQLAGIQLAGDKFSQFRLQHVVPKRAIDEQNPMRTHQLLRRFLFRLLARSYQGVLADHVLNCQPQDFIYREFTFAIISLAAGQFSLLERNSFSGLAPEGLSTYDSNGTSTFLPAFGRGIHKRHVEPGSAPNATTYWFEDVLVSLDDGLGSAESVEAAITKAIQLAHETGRRSFHGLIVSLPEVLLIRVQSTGIVEFTDRLPLLDSAVLQANLNDQDLSCEGFIAMTYLFNATLGPSQPNAGSLSDDVYHQIMDNADWRTYRTCARVSRSFEQYAKSRIRLGDRIITCLQPHRFEDNRNRLTSGFKVVDNTKQTESEWAILPVQESFPSLTILRRQEEKHSSADVSQWHVVIGDGDRLSLIEPLTFQLRKTARPVEHK